MDATLSRYISPVNPTVFPHLATVLLAIGTFFTAWFFVFEGGLVVFFFIDNEMPKLIKNCVHLIRNVVSQPRSNGKESVIFKELLISLFAAVFLGFGVLFLLLSVGIYV